MRSPGGSPKPVTSVILLEAGKSDEKFLIKKPGMIGPMHAVPQLKKTVDLGLSPDLEKHSPRPQDAAVPRAARSSAVRARSTAWSTCAATAPTSTPGPPRATRAWDADSVNAAYKRMEDYEGGEDAYHAAGGPIASPGNKFPQEGPGGSSEATAARWVPINEDATTGSAEGISRMQQNAADGLRYSASRGTYITSPRPR